MAKYSQETYELTRVFNALARVGCFYIEGTLRKVEAQNAKR
jgi:hypothetical protein